MRSVFLSPILLLSFVMAVSCNNSPKSSIQSGVEATSDSNDTTTTTTTVVVTKAEETLSPETEDVAEDYWEYERKQFAADYDVIMQAWLDATNANLQTKAPQKFAILHVDEDGRGELYLRNEDEQIGLLLCHGSGEYTPVMTEFYNNLIRKTENRLYVEQIAGAGYVERSGVELSGSWFYTRFFCSDHTEFDYETNKDVRKISYYCDYEGEEAEERSREFYEKVKNGPAPVALKSVAVWEDIKYMKEGVPDPNRAENN